MSKTNDLVEQHIRSHESRLRHIDELMHQAEEHGDTASQSELAELRVEQQKIGDYIEQFRKKSPEQFMQAAGPMVMWELVAQRLEKLLEKLHSETV